MCPFITLFDACYILWTVRARVLKLHGSKVSRESYLPSVPYNRPVCVRSFLKSVKSLRENQHNSWTVQDNLMKFHRLTQLVKMCVVGKNKNSCSFRFLVICPLTDYGQFLFLSIRHRLIRYSRLWNFIKLSCTVQTSWWFSVKSYGDFHELICSWRYVPIELCYNAVWRCRFLNTLWPLYTSSIDIYLQPANQLVKSAITF